MPDTLHYDYFVIGTGPAGQSFALEAAKAGHAVATCDYQAYGGACPNRGCDPKKVLYAAAYAMHSVKRLLGKGLASPPDLSWEQLQEWKSTFTDHIPEGTRENYAEAGVVCYDGKATFTAPNELLVNDDHRIHADRIIIATGARPAPLDIPGQEHYLTSDGFLSMRDLPERMVIIGSGYIGSSFAQIATVLGCKVTVIASDDNPVDAFDSDLNDLLTGAAEDYGVKFHFKSKAKKIERTGHESYLVHGETDAGETFTVTTQRVIHCAGRVPNADNLNLEAAGIEYGKKGIKVTDDLRTNVPGHYALGDCADSGLPLTPVASYETTLLQDKLLRGHTRKIDYFPIPTVAFTLPPIAAVGMTAEEAKASDKNITTLFEETTEWFTERHVNGLVSAFKIFIDADEDLILGAHLLGHEADEVINLFALAVHEKISVTKLKRMVWAYPTGGGDVTKMLAGYGG